MYSNEYLVVCTSLDETITADEIIELYIYRWQVELYFKRLKSILGYGELPKKSEKSIFSWLNGKLMIALLIESILGQADFPPSITNTRSIWRETKFVKLLLLSNVANPTTVIAGIIPRLQVEKRRKKRPLQMTCILS